MLVNHFLLAESCVDVLTYFVMCVLDGTDPAPALRGRSLSGEFPGACDAPPRVEGATIGAGCGWVVVVFKFLLWFLWGGTPLPRLLLLMKILPFRLVWGVLSEMVKCFCCFFCGWLGDRRGLLFACAFVVDDCGIRFLFGFFLGLLRRTRAFFTFPVLCGNLIPLCGLFRILFFVF